MDLINQNIQNLQNSILESDIYLEYKKQEAILKNKPELWDRVKKMRADNFRLQNDLSLSNDLFVITQKLATEVAELRKSPEVNAFLDAELALCRLLQKVCYKLTQGIEFDVPEF